MHSQDQTSPYGFHPDEGGPVLDYVLSCVVALHTSAVWGHCYENGYRAFFAFPQLFYPEGLFVEGWVVFVDAERVVLMEHGWLVSGAKIIDPTLVLSLAPDQTVFFFPGGDPFLGGDGRA